MSDGERLVQHSVEVRATSHVRVGDGVGSSRRYDHDATARRRTEGFVQTNRRGRSVETREVDPGHSDAGHDGIAVSRLEGEGSHREDCQAKPERTKDQPGSD
ncbi:MAG TPA: hypothetical protein VGK16_08600 [Candidatus Limnocylindrales bacterium]